MLNEFKKSISGPVMATSIALASLLPTAFNVQANDNTQAAQAQTIAAQKAAVQADYVQNCYSNSCAPRRAVNWSERPENQHAVAIAVAMGEDDNVPDYEIKSILEDTFHKLGVYNLKFYFEKNDIADTGITFHVRGDTKGPLVLSGYVFEVAKQVADSAKDDNPLFEKD